MSLIPFHRVLIGTAIAFCFGFAGWELVAFVRVDGDPLRLVLAAGFAAAGVILVVYLRRLRRILGLPG